MIRPVRKARTRPNRLSTWLVTSLAILGLLTIYGAYLTALRLAVEVVPGSGPNQRDGIYFGIHGLALLAAILAGGVLGWFHGRIVFGFAVLFLSVMIVGMIAAQLISFELACAGHNDLIRHWRC